jgi:hypothetical protein
MYGGADAAAPEAPVAVPDVSGGRRHRMRGGDAASSDAAPAVPAISGGVTGGAFVEGGKYTRVSRRSTASRERHYSKKCPKGQSRSKTGHCHERDASKRKYHRRSSESRAFMGLQKLFGRSRCSKGHRKASDGTCVKA